MLESAPLSFATLHATGPRQRHACSVVLGLELQLGLGRLTTP